MGILFRALQATQHELERQQASDSLKKGLGKRPERVELVERMPLLEPSGIRELMKGD